MTRGPARPGEGAQRAALAREVRRRQLRSAAAILPLAALLCFAYPPARLFVPDTDPAAIWIDAAVIFAGWMLFILATAWLSRPLMVLSEEEGASRRAQRQEHGGSGGRNEP